MVLPFQVEAYSALIGGSDRAITYSYAAVFPDISIMAQEDSIGNAGGEGFIRSTDGDVIFHIIIHGVVVADDDEIVTFLSFGTVVFT